MKIGKFDINNQNIKGFLQGHYRKMKEEVSGLPEHQREQIKFRLDQVALKSPQCLLEGACIHCGCSFPEKAYEDRGCEHGCYPDMMNEQDWNNQKFER